VNSLELVEHRLLVSMLVDAHRPDRRYMTRQDLQSDYHTDVDTRLFNSIVADLRKQGIVKATPQGGTYAVRLHSDAYKVALARILATLKADVFDVDWQTKRIITDAEEQDHDGLVPCLENWMLLTCDKKAASASTTPAPATPSLTQTAARDVNNFYGSIHGHGVSNRVEKGGDGWWTRWGTIFGGVSALLAIGALVAAWFFWRFPHL
jgi:hypothetical protein